MYSLAVLGKLAITCLPAGLVKMLHPKRDTYRGAMMEPKAFAIGRLAMATRDAELPRLEESRVDMTKTSVMFDRGAPKLARIEDITVAGADGPLKARLYSDHTSGTHPAMVFYHGGGFVLGDLDSHHRVCAKIAKWWGGVVISVAYRLAPENPYPDGVDDAIAAYEYVVANGHALGIDPMRVGVGGDSAGGCFAAVVAQQVTGMKPKFQALIYPVTDGFLNSASIMDLSDAYILPKTRIDWYLDQYAGEFKDFSEPKFSPLFFEDFSGLPPAYVVTAGFDTLLDDGLRFVDKLKGAGVETVHRNFEGQVHGFINLTKVVSEGTTALQEIAQWLKRVA